jgi:hypothetical protein
MANSQGSVLIVLVVTIIVIGLLGVAVVSLQGTASIHEVRANHAERAYNLAESGFRYAFSTYMSQETVNQKIQELGSLNGTTLHVPSGGKIFYPNIRILNATQAKQTIFTIDGVQQLKSGGSLSIENITDESDTYLSEYNGVFAAEFEDDGATYSFRYLKFNKDESKLENIIGLKSEDKAFLQDEPTFDDQMNCTSLEHARIKSRGEFPGSGDLNVSREVVYWWPLPDASGGDQSPEPPLTIHDFTKEQGATASGNFVVEPDIEGDDALYVEKTTSGSGQGNQPSTEAYVSPSAGETNYFYQAWQNRGGFLSYDAQVKIAMGDWDYRNEEWENRPPYYAAGPLFRAKNPGQQQTFYGLSFFRSRTGKGPNADGIPDSMVPPGGHEDQSMIMLWSRNGNQGNGDDNWLAYQYLDETFYSDYVVDGTDGAIKPWSTLVVRVIEAASIKLDTSNSVSISIDDWIAGEQGNRAKVVKKIRDQDNKVVLLLNNVSDGFTMPDTVYGYSTNGQWGYRSKDAYVWAFYGDTSNHGSNSTPVKQTPEEKRLSNIRRLPSSVEYSLHWPSQVIGNWSADIDNFTLVQWANHLNTGEDQSIHRMGKGKEYNGIIRTQKWITEGNLQEEGFPPEFGLHALGSFATQIYYDDVGLYIQGLSGDSEFIPPIHQ